MERNHSITSIDSEIQKIEAKQIMDAFRKSGKSMHELMIFLEG